MQNDTPYVILVDGNDREIGFEEKIAAHKYAMLHRAFSVFVFRQRKGNNELLLQQRHKNKYHAGGAWTNTCCSHPEPGQKDILQAAQNRLQEEMGLKVNLSYKGMFHYVAIFDNGLYENEIDHVFTGELNGDVNIPFNKYEVSQCKWIDVENLMSDMKRNPEKYTPWLQQALSVALSKYKSD